MVRHFRFGPAGSLWIVWVVLSVGTAAATRPVAAKADSRSLDEAWFAILAPAESLMSVASCRGEVDSTDRAAVVEQIRLGVQVLGSFVRAAVAADTMLAGPLATARPHKPPAGVHGILKAAGVISAAAGLMHVIASLSSASAPTRSVLGYVGGSAAGVGGVLSALIARPSSPPAMDNIDRMHALDLETDLRASIYETERAAESLWEDLQGMALDSCVTDQQIAWLARRYVNALQEASVFVDSRVTGTAANAWSCAEHPGFTAKSREHCGAFASHLDTVDAMWQERRWLVERSKRNTLDYLALTDRP